MNKNFLNNFYNLPNFSTVQLNNNIQKKIANCYNAVDQIILQNKATTWDDFYYPLMIAENELQLAWSLIVHLNSVQNNSKSRSLYKSHLFSIIEYKNWLNHNNGLHKLYKKLHNSNLYHNFNNIQKAALNKILINYKLAGISLPYNKKKRYKHIISELSNLSIKYTDNVLDATYGWQKTITNKTVLSGIPKHILKQAYKLAQSNQQKGWLFNLQYSHYSSILSYCDDAKLREEFYWAFNTRASDQGPNKGKWDNTGIIQEILSLRHELSRILGFNNYFEKSLITKTAQSSKQVFKFLMNLSNHLIPNANKEFLKIQNFAKKYYSNTHLQPWDLAYYQEKQKKHLFSITNIELQNFFTINTVLSGMFTVAQNIYNITITQRKNVNTWHPDVTFFDIFDVNNQWKGGFYMDLFQRPHKHEGAWVDVYTNKMYYNKLNMQYQRPIAFLICNINLFTDSNKSNLLTHNDVITLFHEFGHVLQHILTSIDIPIISGINSIPEDIVEISSQFMEKFCWDPYVLKIISKHHQTKKNLPIDKIYKLSQLKKYQSSLNLLQQVIYSLFDYRIHYEYIPQKNTQISKMFKEIIKDMPVYGKTNVTMDTDRFFNSFIHIFADDDYAAGYYSYLWSDMLASHIWLSMKKSKFSNEKIRNFFLKKIFDLNKSTNLKTYFDHFSSSTITTQSIFQYYEIPVLNNTFFKLT